MRRTHWQLSGSAPSSTDIVPQTATRSAARLVWGSAMSLLSDIAGFWMEGTMRTLEAFSQGYGSPETDPPATTPYEVVYEAGMLRLRHYRPVERRHKRPLLIVYALIKRPFILDLQPGKSVLETLLG